MVRAVSGDPALIKQLLDIGVQTLLVPMVDTPEQAAALVAAPAASEFGFGTDGIMSAAGASAY